MIRAPKSHGFANNTERRNFRRVMFAVSVLALAALGNAARAGEAESAVRGLVVSLGYTWARGQAA
jgi:hypothetical protein